MVHWFVLVRGFWAYSRLWLPLVLAAFLCGVAVAALATVDSQIIATNGESVRLAVPKGTVLFSGRLEAEDKAVVDRAGAIRVVDVEADLRSSSGPSRLISAATRIADGPAPGRGVLVSGRWPRGEREAVVSGQVAAVLGIGRGETVEVAGEPSVVVGVMIDPGNPSGLTAFVRTQVSDARATGRVMSLSAYRGIAAQIPDAVVVYSDEASGKGESFKHPQPIGGGWMTATLVATVLLLGSALRLGCREITRDLTAWVEAGGRRGRLVTQAGLLVGVLIGAAGLCGVAVGAAGVNLGRGRLGSWWGQAWLDQRWDLPMMGLVVVVLAVGPFLAFWAWERLRVDVRAVTGLATWVVTGALVVLLLGFSGWLYGSGSPYSAGPFLGVGLVNAIVLLLGGWLTWRARRSENATTAVLAEARQGTVVIAAVLGTLVFAFTFSAVRTWNNYATEQVYDIADSGQRPGALVLRFVPDSAAEKLISRWVKLGGHTPFASREVSFPEGESEAVTPRMAACLRADPTIDPVAPPVHCLGPRDYIQVLAVGASVWSGDRVRAAREIVRGGETGIIRHASPGSDQLSEVTTVPATPENALGGYMPGVLLDRATLRRLGGVVKSEQALYFDNYPRASAQTQAEFRAIVQRLAPEAVPFVNATELNTIWPRPVPKSMYVISLGGALVLATATTLLLGSFVSASGDLRLNYVLLGASRATRRRLARRVLLLPLLACLLSTLAAPITLQWMRSFVPWDRSAAGFGWFWLPPAAVALIGVIAATFAYARAPARD